MSKPVPTAPLSGTPVHDFPSVEYATLSQLWYFRRRNYSFKWKSTYEFAAECKRKGYYEAPLRVYASALNQYMN